VNGDERTAPGAVGTAPPAAGRGGGPSWPGAGSAGWGRDAAPAGPKRPWYRRRSFVVGVVVAAVLAVTVVTDLPQPATRASQISESTAIMQEVNADIAACAYATHESFLIYHDQTAHTLTASDRSRVPGLLRDDQSACSFTNSSIFDLSSNINTPDTPAGRHLGQLVAVIMLWSTSDALGAIEDIQTLTDHPQNAKALRDLTRREKLLDHDRAQVVAQLDGADRVLRTHLPGPGLPTVPTS